MSKHQTILETVGNTPVVRINRLAPPGVDLFVKVEAFNPLFADIGVDMNEEEMRISRSTPLAQFPA